jgi:CMP-N-acetylneuraminic acid synthetase
VETGKAADGGILNIVGLIPARGGSKAIPGKNIVSLAGRPLIAYAIQAARRSELLDRVVVSTDDSEIRKVSLGLGAEVPFVRPEALAGDDASALGVIQHAVHTLEQDENRRLDLVVYLQPTSPFRTHRHIDAGLRLMLDSGADTLVSTVAVPHRYTPRSLMELGEDHTLRPCGSDANPRRQDKQRLYARNGPALLILRRDRVDDDRLYSGRTIGMEMDWRSSIDIDSTEDLDIAECLMKCAESATAG